MFSDFSQYFDHHFLVFSRGPHFGGRIVHQNVVLEKIKHVLGLLLTVHGNTMG